MILGNQAFGFVVYPTVLELTERSHVDGCGRGCRWLADHLRKMVSARPAAWAGSELTLGQLLALHFINAKAPITLMSLSHTLGLRPPATSAMVDRLSRAGMVCRRPDPADRRRVLLTVTANAVAMMDKIDLQTARRLQVVLASMGAAAQRCLIEVVRDTARRLTG